MDWVECDCIRQAEQFGYLMEEYRERFFTYVLLQSSKQSVATHLESYLLHRHYASQLDNLYDNIEVDLLDVDWTKTMHITKCGGIVELVYSKQ